MQAEVKAEAGRTLWEVGREAEVGGTSREVKRRAETVWDKGVPLTVAIYAFSGNLVCCKGFFTDLVKKSKPFI